MLDAFGLVASDVAATTAFYRRAGVPIPPEMDGEQHVEVDLGGGVRFMIDSEELMRSLDPAWSAAERGRVSLAIRCSSPNAVDEAVETLRAAGAPVATEPWDAFWGQRYATVVDPDGVHVDFYAPLDA